MKHKPILYIKPGCPWCREAMAFFSQHGVELDVRDVTKSEASMHRMIEISGQSLTPTLEHGDFVVADFSVNELLDELEQVPEIKKEWGLGDEEDRPLARRFTMYEPNLTRPWLTPGQRRLTALAVCTVAGLVLLMVAALGIWGLRVFIAAFGYVIWPLVIAGILAVLLRPVVNSLQNKLKLPRVRAILLLYFLIVSACLALGILLLPLMASQLIELSHTGPDIIKRGILRIREILREYPDINQAVKSYLDEKGLLNQVNAANEHVLSLLLSAHSTFRTVLDYSAGLAVIPIYLFFLLLSNRNFSRDFREELTFLPTAVREDIVFLSTEFAGIMVSFFHGRLLIGLIMGVMQALGFFAIGLQGGFVLGLFFGLLNVVPFLGMVLGVAVILPIAFIQTGGGWPLLLEAAAVFAVVQVAEAYYFTPKIMGERTGLHPMVILLSIFFWGEALHGLLGIILGVPLTAFLVVAWRLLKTKYLPQHTTRPPMPRK